MLLDIILISFIIAFLRKGKVREYPTFNRVWLLIASVILQLLSFIAPHMGPWFVSFGYLFMLFFLIENRQHEDVRIFLVGWLLNAVAIWVNFGRMPVDLNVARKTPFPVQGLLDGTDWKHTLISSYTHLPFLGDVFFIPYPIPRVVSIGDIFVALGAFLFIQRIMGKPISLINLRMGKKYENN